MKTWSQRKSLTPGRKNVSQEPLVPSDNFFLPPLASTTTYKVGTHEKFSESYEQGWCRLSISQNKISSNQ